jgi:catalase
VQAPQPAPSSFARESFFGVTAMRFTNNNGVSRYGRYRIVPKTESDHPADAVAAAKRANFLFDELAERIAGGPIAFNVSAQLANDDDVADDATVRWPEERTLLNLGAFTCGAVPLDRSRPPGRLGRDEGVRPTLLSGRDRHAYLSANHVAGDHQFYPSILLPA